MQTKLPTPLDAEQARAVMPGFIEYGLLSQNSLIMLQQLMSNIFVPLLNVKSISTNEGNNLTHILRLDSVIFQMSDQENL